MNSANPGLYLHIPFCSAICPYCDFAVLTGGPERRRRFADHLISEISLWSRSAPRLMPSTRSTSAAALPRRLRRRTSPGSLRPLAKTFRSRMAPGSPSRPIPRTSIRESVRAWRDLGVRFLSLGIQSFDADALKFLGRRHTPEEARRSVETARAAGFDTISIDLIYGLPEQPFEIWRRTLEQAVAPRAGPHLLLSAHLSRGNAVRAPARDGAR